MNFSDYMPNTIMNMFGPNTGVNVDDMSMAQKRGLYGSMFDPMEAGRERLRAMTAPEVIPGAGVDPMSVLSYLGGMQQLGLLNTEPVRGPQISQMPQATPGYQYTPVDLYKGGLLGGLV
jgi:hypothetical protein